MCSPAKSISAPHNRCHSLSFHRYILTSLLLSRSYLMSSHPRTNNLCQFPFSDGRRCALPLTSAHPHLCTFHSQRERRLLDADRIAALLTANASRIRTATDLNLFLTRLVFYTASQRIPKSTSRTLAYLASLIMQSLPSVKNEYQRVFGIRQWDAFLQTSVSDAYAETSDPELSPEPDSEL